MIPAVCVVCLHGFWVTGRRLRHRDDPPDAEPEEILCPACAHDTDDRGWLHRWEGR